jgi:hypothetical protein
LQTCSCHPPVLFASFSCLVWQAWKLRQKRVYKTTQKTFRERT